MNILSLIPAFLRAIASAPAASSFLSPHVDALLLAAASLIERGEAGATELEALTAQIEAMIEANRDPTPEEWAALHARSDAAHAILQASDGTPPLTQAPTS